MAIINRRMMASIEGDFVVFLIGMRINRPWKIHKWLPVALAMPRMLKELAAHPEMGCLGAEVYLGMTVQYWRSFEALEAYARNRDAAHFPAWTAFNRRVGAGDDVGIWHETFKVAAGQYEAFYNHMPPKGLGKIGALSEATGARASAAGRLGIEGHEPPPDALLGS